MFLGNVILWFYVSTIYFSSVEAMACYTFDIAESEKAGAIEEGHGCCRFRLEFSSFYEHYYVTYYFYYGDSECFCDEGDGESCCMFDGWNTTEPKLIYNDKTGSCDDDYGPLIEHFHDEKSASEIRKGFISCGCKSSSICATQPETFEKLKAVTKDIGERRAAELMANWLRTDAIFIKGKDTLPEFRATTTTTKTTTKPVTSTTKTVTTTKETVTPSAKVVTDTKEVSTVALKAEKSQDSKEKCPSCDNQGLPLIGLGILCLILIAVTIALVMRIRGIQNELKKRDLERGAGTTRKDHKSSGSSEVKSAPTGIKSTGSGSTDKTVGSKESGSTEKAGPKSVTGGEPIRSKE